MNFSINQAVKQTRFLFLTLVILWCKVLPFAALYPQNQASVAEMAPILIIPFIPIDSILPETGASLAIPLRFTRNPLARFRLSSIYN